MGHPLILDLDGSVGPIDGAERIDLRDWQDAVRFGATSRVFRGFVDLLESRLPREHGTVLLGSGDFHHLSWPLIARASADGPFQVVVLDNHPDNMRFPFGIHCGSWVREVARLPQVSRVHVVGITSGDIGLAHALENYWRPLRQGRVTYWSLGVDTRWARWAGVGHAFRTADNPEALVAGLLAALGPEPVYLTIDKDVLAPEVVQTNWDQGVFRESHVLDIIRAVRSRLVGSDITGEVSQWRYRAFWKRLLSGLDGQPEIDAAQLAAWQAEHTALDRRLIAAMAGE